MIFCSRNEKGELASDLIMSDRKTITRRCKPEPVGRIRACCPGRGKKAVCHILILSCMPDTVWKRMTDYSSPNHKRELLEEEAHREGFESWSGLYNWFLKKYGGWPRPLYRIEFKRLEDM